MEYDSDRPMVPRTPVPTVTTMSESPPPPRTPSAMIPRYPVPNPTTTSASPPPLPSTMIPPHVLILLLFGFALATRRVFCEASRSVHHACLRLRLRGYDRKGRGGGSNAEGEPAGWLHSLLDQLLGSLNVALPGLVATYVTPNLQATKPPGVTNVRVAKVDLGTRVPHLHSFVTTTTADSLFVDFTLVLDSNVDIQAHADLKAGARVGLQFRNVKLTAKMRLVLAPLASRLPLVRAVAVSFRHRPLLSYRLAGLGAAPVPAFLMTWLSGLISKSILETYVWPLRLFVPLDLDAPLWTLEPRPTFVVEVTVLRVSPTQYEGKGKKKKEKKSKTTRIETPTIGNVALSRLNFVTTGATRPWRSRPASAYLSAAAPILGHHHQISGIDSFLRLVKASRESIYVHLVRGGKIKRGNSNVTGGRVLARAELSVAQVAHRGGHCDSGGGYDDDSSDKQIVDGDEEIDVIQEDEEQRAPPNAPRSAVSQRTCTLPLVAPGSPLPIGYLDLSVQLRPPIPNSATGSVYVCVLAVRGIPKCDAVGWAEPYLVFSIVSSSVRGIAPAPPTATAKPTFISADSHHRPIRTSTRPCVSDMHSVSFGGEPGTFHHVRRVGTYLQLELFDADVFRKDDKVAHWEMGVEELARMTRATFGGRIHVQSEVRVSERATRASRSKPWNARLHGPAHRPVYHNNHDHTYTAEIELDLLARFVGY